jgi:hypothetical protein
LDLGAGRQQLRRYIDPDSSYTAADLVARDADTLVIDLNARPLPRLGRRSFDVAVLAGVIEYVSHVDTLLEWLHMHFAFCVVSYGCAQNMKGLKRLRQSWRRMTCGWVNSFTEEELCKRFTSRGFFLSATADWKTDDGDERIFLFQRRCDWP